MRFLIWIYAWIALVAILVNIATFCYWQPMWAHYFRDWLLKESCSQNGEEL